MRNMGLGPLVDVSLAEARRKAAKHRNTLRDGQDPLAQRRAAQQANRAVIEKQKTFSECSAAYIEAHSPSWSNPKHRAQWTNTLKTYAEPSLGNKLVSDVDTEAVLKVLEPIWLTKTETARRVRQRIERVLDWAKARGYRSGDNPAQWKGHLDKLLAKSPDKVRHFNAMPYGEISDFMDNLRALHSISARALELTILTATRTGEVIAARWEEFNGDVWTIPAARMKSGREHRVPLSSAARRNLDRIPEITDFLFPGIGGNDHISNMTMLKVLRDLTGEQYKYTVHGFRSTFRDWAAETTAYPNHVQEMALAHTIKSDVEAAYRRGDLFEKRRRLMEAWAQFIAAENSADLVRIRS